jgi:hypothetical protein
LESLDVCWDGCWGVCMDVDEFEPNSNLSTEYLNLSQEIIWDKILKIWAKKSNSKFKFKILSIAYGGGINLVGILNLISGGKNSQIA